MNGLKVFEILDIFFLSDRVKGAQILVLILRQWGNTSWFVCGHKAAQRAHIVRIDATSPDVVGSQHQYLDTRELMRLTHL